VQTDAPDLLYMRARYYSPSIGRFLNKDPIQVNYWQLNQFLNRYVYTDDNPINRIDPEGKIFLVPAFIVVVKVVAGVISAIVVIERILEYNREWKQYPEAPGPANNPIVAPRPQYGGRCPVPK
jgi:RHS repeat-associated protein